MFSVKPGEILVLRVQDQQGSEKNNSRRFFVKRDLDNIVFTHYVFVEFSKTGQTAGVCCCYALTKSGWAVHCLYRKLHMNSYEISHAIIIISQYNLHYSACHVSPHIFHM